MSKVLCTHMCHPNICEPREVNIHLFVFTESCDLGSCSDGGLYTTAGVDVHVVLLHCPSVQREQAY